MIMPLSLEKSVEILEEIRNSVYYILGIYKIDISVVIILAIQEDMD